MRCRYLLLFVGAVFGRTVVEKEKETTEFEWSYNFPSFNGPYSWGKYYPECNGYSQSPINLPTVFADMSFLDRLQYQGWRDNQFDWKLENDGKAVHLYVPDNVETRPCVTTNAGKFLLSAIVFRVGSSPDWGSEHGMNGRYYAGEVQKYFYSSEYKNFEEASKVPGNIAVVSHILESTEHDNPGFNGFIENLYKINGTSKSTSLDWYSEVLFQGDGKKCEDCDYFFYEGSLSFPPCSEVALWHVMMATISISEKQLNILRSIVSAADEPMVYNFRHTQPANFRDILQHRERDPKAYDNYPPSTHPMVAPPGSYPPVAAYDQGLVPPTGADSPPMIPLAEAAYPSMPLPAYMPDQKDSSTSSDGYPQPYPGHHPPPHPYLYPYHPQPTPSPNYEEPSPDSPSSYPPNPYPYHQHYPYPYPNPPQPTVAPYPPVTTPDYELPTTLPHYPTDPPSRYIPENTPPQDYEVPSTLPHYPYPYPHPPQPTVAPYPPVTTPDYELSTAPPHYPTDPPSRYYQPTGSQLDYEETNARLRYKQANARYHGPTAAPGYQPTTPTPTTKTPYQTTTTPQTTTTTTPKTTTTTTTPKTTTTTTTPKTTTTTTPKTTTTTTKSTTTTAPTTKTPYQTTETPYPSNAYEQPSYPSPSGYYQQNYPLYQQYNPSRYYPRFG